MDRARKMKQYNRGFTLIELLVVISVIAVLSVVGIALFTNAQAQARDGRRRADIDAIATAMEANKNGNNYPNYNGSIFANGQTPTDPIGGSFGGNTYTYTTPPTTGTTNYVACARLEKGGGNAASVPALGTSITPGTIFYCRINQQ